MYLTPTESLVLRYCSGSQQTVPDLQEKFREEGRNYPGLIQRTVIRLGDKGLVEACGVLNNWTLWRTTIEGNQAWEKNETRAQLDLSRQLRA